ncbi:hypothetical protein HWC44_gp102 [Mycobacterium phage ThetaBob]|uniref:Uncharacterized protein n=2 Tax=Thetabobvirus TaxID=2843467 RepID=A0A385E2D5_9CAUD|nr:hypothetical protein HWB85_gp109 [Mycobacterium phage Renaud18]YP_009848921.1 hypothetical protein HWC44_gp102 [Mycobacterium phage ThetaBob]AXQ65015.1 hypothetical protein SEA_RENAUD18_109 [Mycobacterium phage Renaud18]QDF19989.1 hypothetical protein SEA_THETABOB_102 [Mycobacterium phage ThetaBob]
MTNIRISVDDKVLMDADPGTWTTTPPDIESLKQHLGGVDEPQPYMQAIMLALAKVATYAMVGKQQPSTTIAVTTRPTGWTLSVDET